MYNSNGFPFVGPRGSIDRQMQNLYFFFFTLHHATSRLAKRVKTNLSYCGATLCAKSATIADLIVHSFWSKFLFSKAPVGTHYCFFTNKVKTCL